MRLTHKHKYKTDNKRFVFDMKDYHKACQKLADLEDIEDNLPAFNGLQHLFAVINLMEQDEVLCFTYKGKSFVIERNE